MHDAGWHEVLRGHLEAGRHARLYEYTVRDGVMPMTGFRGSIKVEESGEGSRVLWNAKFTAAGIPEDEAVGMIGGI